MAGKVDKQVITKVLNRLKKRFPAPGAMEIGNPYQSLVAVALSARTRDEQVLKLMPNFLRAFPTPLELSLATESEIRKKINTIGMYRQKAKNLKKMGGQLVQDFQGQVPGTMEDLVKLAGVGRKTASVVLPLHFGIPAIAVDTHVHRVTNRLGWVKTSTPEKTERALREIISEKQMRKVNQVFVKHGRYICISKPRCWACPVQDMCPFKQKNLEPPKNAKAILADIDRREEVLESLRQAVLRVDASEKN